MILYGRNPVMESLRGRRARTVSEVWATPGAAREPWLEGIAVRRSTPGEIAERCGSEAHQGICAQAGGYPYVSAEELLGMAEEGPGSRRSAGDLLIVALDQVQDPQNLGSICRTAECAGATGVVIPERRSAEVTPAVCKASAGAVEHLRVARVRNLADFLVHAREAGCWSYGASAPSREGLSSEGLSREGLSGEGLSGEGLSGEGLSGTRPGATGPRTESAARGGGRAGAAVPYDRPDYRGGVVLVLGSEGRGLRPRVAGSCDELIALPLLGRVESLGVSAAAAAILYEILQNRLRPLDNAP